MSAMIPAGRDSSSFSKGAVSPWLRKSRASKPATARLQARTFMEEQTPDLEVAEVAQPALDYLPFLVGVVVRQRLVDGLRRWPLRGSDPLRSMSAEKLRAEKFGEHPAFHLLRNSQALAEKDGWRQVTQ